MPTNTTEGLQLYSRLTDNRIGEAVNEPARIADITDTYIEYAQFLTFNIDNTTEKRIRFARWRKPIDGEYWYQFSRIINNNTGFVTIEFAHINNAVLDSINSFRSARIGGSIANGQLQPSSNNLDVTVTKLSNNEGFQLSVNNGQFVFTFNPDTLTADNADEVDFITE
jgi:hypothetical protein